MDDRRRWLFDTLPRESAELHDDIFDKRSQKRLARRLGLLVAEDYVFGVPLREALDHVEQQGIHQFAIKPTSSKGGIGFHALVRDGETFVDLVTRRRWSRRRLERVLPHELITGRDDSWIVEELLLPADGGVERVADFKMYCIGGRVELVLHKRPEPRGRKRFDARFFTRDWQPVNVGLEDRDDLLDGVSVPTNGRLLIDTAERAASQLCYPFIRIDLYDSQRGIVLGEFTPSPGRKYGFNAKWDAYLARRWQEAATAIEEGVRSGHIVPLGAVAPADAPD